ncbi:MAG: P1 family peptidase, partial [Acidobacteria bacterium]|nr:P1 family peptidase [Acidobacteriota bacterium]
GCTAILFPGGAVAGVDVRGAAVGEREFETLRVGHLVERIHGLLLAGGSAFGLEAAAGVLRYLEEQGIGFDTGVARVPIVPAAIIFDLAIGDAKRRPDAAMGYQAAQAASADKVEEGSIGAGTGATVGKLFGLRQATKGGLGTTTIELAGGVLVSALAVVNAFGDVRDPATGQIIAGARRAPASSEFADMAAQMKAGVTKAGFGASPASSTTLVVVATNARLDRPQATKLAAMAQNGLARAISPVHTLFDGDVVFGVSLGTKSADLNRLGSVATEAVAAAILRAVRAASSLGGVPAVPDLATLTR